MEERLGKTEDFIFHHFISDITRIKTMMIMHLKKSICNTSRRQKDIQLAIKGNCADQDKCNSVIMKEKVYEEMNRAMFLSPKKVKVGHKAVKTTAILEKCCF